MIGYHRTHSSLSSMRHENRYRHHFQHGSCRTAEHNLPPPRMAIAAHYDEVRVEVRCARQQQRTYREVLYALRILGNHIDPVPSDDDRDIRAGNSTCGRLTLERIDRKHGDPL